MLPVPGRTVPKHKGDGRMRDGRRVEKRRGGKFDFEGASRQLPCVLYFSWGLIANGARPELA